MLRQLVLPVLTIVICMFSVGNAKAFDCAYSADVVGRCSGDYSSNCNEIRAAYELNCVSPSYSKPQNKTMPAPVRPEYEPAYSPPDQPKSNSDPEIKTYQVMLEKFCLNTGGADGFWGTNTSRAVVKFQADNGLKQTGQLDSKTKKQISAEYGKLERNYGPNFNGCFPVATANTRASPGGAESDDEYALNNQISDDPSMKCTNLYNERSFRIRSEISEVKTLLDTIKTVRLDVPGPLLSAMSLVNEALDKGTDAGEAYLEVGIELRRLVEDEFYLCQQLPYEDQGICEAKIVRPWMLRNVKKVLNYSDRTSWVRKTANKWADCKIDGTTTYGTTSSSTPVAEENTEGFLEWAACIAQNGRAACEK